MQVTVALARGARGVRTDSQIKVAAFILLHVPLALLMRKASGVATFHALFTLLAGLWWAAPGKRLQRVRVACVGAYIAGAEVLWRMTNARVFYEFGKYAIAAIFIIGILRIGRLKVRILPSLYFIFLLPSIPLTIAAIPERARLELSFSLSGPFALMVCVWFLSHVSLSAEEMHRLLVTAIGPLAGVAAVAAFKTATASSLSFTSSSNYLTSGGFGPNQVSAVLGLGALLAFLIVMDERTSPKLRRLMLLVSIWLAIQSAMTFSRGGIYIAIGSAMAGSIFLLRTPRARTRFLFVAVVLCALANFVIVPRLNQLTGGMFAERFQNTRPTGRDNLVQSDLELWKNSPAMGVGPGTSAFARQSSLFLYAPHTEFSRLVAEHGVLGLFALCTFVAMGVQSFRRARSARSRFLTVTMLSWSCLFMLVNAMRVAAPAFLFGLSFAGLDPKRLMVRVRARSTSTADEHAAACVSRL